MLAWRATHSGNEILAANDEPGASDETTHLFALGEGAGPPLAAVFRTRRAGKRRSRREAPLRDPRREPEPTPGESFDVVLTDDLRVERTRRTGPIDTQETDEFPAVPGFGDGPVDLEPTRPMQSAALAEAEAARAEARAVAEAAKSEAEEAKTEAEAAKTEAEAAKAEAEAVKAEAEAVKAELELARAEAEAAKAEVVAAKAEVVAAKNETLSPSEEQTTEPVADAQVVVSAAAPAGAVPTHLADIIPPDADPVWAAQAVLGLASARAKANRTPADGAWFAEVFRNEYLLAHPMRADHTSEREAEFIENQLCVATGGRLFDLCCGYGRHTLPLARKGFELVGLDLSLDMLKHALTQAQKESLSIKFVHGDMRDLNFDEVFDGGYSLDTSFGFFSDAENLMVLRGVHRALKSGGRFVLDIANRDFAIRDIPNRNWWEGDGCLVQEDIEFNHLESRLRIKRFLVFADGLQREYDISLRLYSAHELTRMLALVGFEVVDISGSTHTAGAFFGDASHRIIVTAQKA